MVEVRCECGVQWESAESDIGKAETCPKCERVTHLVCAEQLPDGAGAGDFDAFLTIQSGPQKVGERFLLGGVPDILIGKLPDKQIVLPGQRVSRLHCKLTRVDFGPSRWRLEDNQSTNGLFVNGQRVQQHELKDSDTVGIGEYQLKFLCPEPVLAAPPPAPVAAVAAAPAAAAAPRPNPMLGPTVLPYRRGLGQSEEERFLLRNSDQKWVEKLRTGASLMVLGVGLGISAGWISGQFEIENLETYLEIAIAILGWVATWMLTTREPNATETKTWQISRLALRIVATITICLEITSGALVLTNPPFSQTSQAEDATAVAGGADISRSLKTSEEASDGEDVDDMPPLTINKGFAAGVIAKMVSLLSRAVQVGLFLFYMRLLALRIPDTILASNALIVMVGLPTTIATMALGAVIVGAKAGTGGGGGAIGMICLGGCGVIIFAIWYLVLLSWFAKSLKFA